MAASLVAQLEAAAQWLLEPEAHVLAEFGHKLNDELKVDLWANLPWVAAGALVWGLAMRLFDSKSLYVVSMVHATAVTLLGLVNLYIGPEGDHFEHVLFVVMTSYFVADFFTYCLSWRLAIFGFHHAVTATALWRMANFANWNSTLFLSKCVLLELSTPFMSVSSRHRVFGLLFIASFFLVRVVWLGYLAVTGLQVSLNKFEHLIVVSFTALNYYWFWQILIQAKRVYDKERELKKAREEE